MRKLFSLCLVFGLSMSASAGDNSRVYEIVHRSCLSGTLNANASPLREGIRVTRDFFDRDPQHVQEALDKANWEDVELQFKVGGMPGTVCSNNSNPTTLIFKVKRIK